MTSIHVSAERTQTSFLFALWSPTVGGLTILLCACGVEYHAIAHWPTTWRAACRGCDKPEDNSGYKIFACACGSRYEAHKAAKAKGCLTCKIKKEQT